MRWRTFLLHAALAQCVTVAAQSCFTVAQQEDLRPLSGCVALDARRVVLGVSDASGGLCLAATVDTLVLECTGRVPLRMALNDALRQGLVLLGPADRELEVLAVEPWPTRRERQALATASEPDSTVLQASERSSLRSALIWVPGVQMDQRGLGGSTRLSIRGSLLRAPFGVRGVKAYWGPFALTLADGSTPLELLDPSMVGTIEVVRSVGSPVFGSAPAGLLLARPPSRSTQGGEVDAELIGGPNGYYRMAVQAGTSSGRNSLSTGLVKQGNDGYRAQEWTSREQAWLVNTVRGARGITRTYLTGQHATWALPGSVDSLTAYTDPRAPRPYSELVNAHVEKTQLLAGLHHEHRLGSDLLVRTGLQAQYIEKVNPYGTSPVNCGYKDETILATGARLELAGEHRLNAVQLAWQLGMEALFERDKLEERTYVDGVVGDLRTDADSRVGNLNGFAALQVRKGRFTLAGALGSERTTVDHTDQLRDTVIVNAGEPVLYPSLGLTGRVSRHLYAHVRQAASVSRPTLWEQLGTAGVMNSTLGPERVQELEAGLALGADTARLRLSAVAYHRTTEGLILPATADNGTDVVYTNAGDARQNGVEVAFAFTSAIRGRYRLHGQGFAVLQDHVLRPSASGQERPVPGVPRSTIGARVSLGAAKGPAMEVGYRWVDRTPADLLKEDLIAPYGLLQIRASWTLGLSGGTLSAFLHLDNVLDQRYTAFVQVNDPGGRYYNPAPGRSLFGGLRFQWGARP
ncbi:MAG: TonB-dependent receptor [Flavobacteriales bacterium]|nr:TonB-dependent receptor [Flavobacteriales bacterium]